MVTLTTGKKTQDFEVNHAERILRMKKNGGWKLPEDSHYKFDLKNGIKKGRNTEEVQKARKKLDNRSSGKPRTEA